MKHVCADWRAASLGAFPNDEAIFKLLWLGLREASKKWKRPIRNWKAALNQFVILYGDRVPIEP